MRRFVRTVLLADMDAFFASVEQAHNPALRGKPVIVCGDPEKRHGIVLAASYEAKRCGVKTAMLVGEARRLCPEAVFVLPRMATYVQISNAILAMMKEITPLVEPFSIDEAFLELPDATDLVRDGVETARRLKDRIRREIGVSCSIGVGPNKLLAKMAAGLEKPDGLTVLTLDDVPTRLWPLPVRELFGVGPRMERHFYRMGIRTIGHLAQADPDRLARRFGLMGRVLHLSANGIDYSPVDPGSLAVRRSIGHMFTLPRDYRTLDELRVVLLELVDDVCHRARTRGYVGQTVSLTLRFADLSGLHRQKKLEAPTNVTPPVFAAAFHLLQRFWNGQPVRMVGVSLGNLMPDTGFQLDLFGREERQRRLAAAIDHIRARHGKTSLLRAVSLTPPSVFFDRAGKIGGHRK
ncbi:MAG: DNA polymerase IV [Bacillota bacterium]|nr:DNA polymerase IV [Bacillota bacterium]